MKYNATILNGDYLGSEPISLDFPCEIHFTRFGTAQYRSENNSYEQYANIQFVDLLNNFKVFICSNEPTSSHSRETVFNIIQNYFAYDLILTTNKEILDNCPNAKFFPYGTTWLNKDKHHPDALGKFDESLIEQVKDKNFNVSFVTANRRIKEGYEIRYAIWNGRSEITVPTLFYSSTRDPTNTRGYSNTLHDGFLPNDDKINLFKSQFSIAVESTKEESYFTEKLIDCLLTKTVPIYWGAPDIDKFFDVRGFIIINNYSDLVEKVNKLTDKTYEEMLPYIEENFNRAKEYGRPFFSRIQDAIEETYNNQKAKTDILWTIGILTIPERVEKLNILLSQLKFTVPFRFKNRIEILVNEDNKEKSIGQKRNEILEDASGKYICFIDDDDMVTPSYLSILGDELDKNKYDAIGFWGKYMYNGYPIMLFNHANEHKKDYRSANGRIQYRILNHLNPIRTEIAKQIKFLEINHGEDSNYAKKLFESNLIKTEINLKQVIYYYYYYETEDKIGRKQWTK